MAAAVPDTGAAAPGAATDVEADRVRAERCRNCGAAAPRRFCPECGQETTVALPTARQFLTEAAGR
jgi:uncharacterized OB-fold protein